MARQKVSPRITLRLTPRQLKSHSAALAASLARNELNVQKVAAECSTLPRSVRKWISIATIRGHDVLEVARTILRTSGIDPKTLLAERVREGMADARKLTDRSVNFSPKPRKRGLRKKVSVHKSAKGHKKVS